MSFFSKNKITMHDLANGVADFVLKNQSPKSLKQYSNLLKEIGEDNNINEKQKRELLVFDMLAATLAIQKAFDNSSQKQNLLDCFHENIYKRISDIEKSLVEFEKFVQERYRTYYEILSSKEENTMFNLGRRFNSYFLNHSVEGKELVLTVSSVRIFGLTIENIKNFLIEVLAKYEII